jgi:tetratricopeptide (TPR) repeat protein
LGNYYRIHNDYARALNYHQEALQICKKQDLTLMQSSLTWVLVIPYMQTGQFKLAVKNYGEAETLAKNADEKDKLKEAYKRLAISYAQTRDYKKAFEYQSLLTSIQDMLYNDSTSQKINNLQFDFEMQKKEGEIDLLTRDKNLQDLLLQRQKVVTNSLIVVVLLVFAIGFIIYQNYRAKAAINKILDSQKAEIERLLLNILPAEVAEELQRNGSATPRYYESASVLFTDFKSFTILADKFSPQALVAELNETFIAFDAIIQKYNLEKIKTIGMRTCVQEEFLQPIPRIRLILLMLLRDYSMDGKCQSAQA